MGAEWEDIFSFWAKPPSQSEADKIENSVAAIRKALDADDFLASRTKVFVQGSYRNRVIEAKDNDQTSIDESEKVIKFFSFQEAKKWSIENPGKVFTKSPDGTGYIVKNI